jgi:hypothetical protein
MESCSSNKARVLDFEQIRVKNPERARYLLGVPAISEVLSAAESVALTEKTRAQLLALIQNIGHVPVGAVLPWLKTFPGTPQALPEQFVECNGQIVTDTASPFFGLTLPNLNGENRFLRGNATSGGTGGVDTHAHAVSTPTQVPSATTTAGSGAAVSVPTAAHTHNTNFSTQTADGKPPYYNVVWIIRIK